MQNKKALFWSGGLSSLSCLKHLIKNGCSKNEIILITLLSKEANEVGYTGIPEEIISLQARYMGMKLVRLYNNELSNKVVIKLKEQGYQFYSGQRNEKFTKQLAIADININTPFMGLAYTEFLEDQNNRAILTSVDREDQQRFLGKELRDIDIDFNEMDIDTFVIFDPLMRIRIPFSKNIIVEKDNHFICKIRNV
ncbi:putative lipoprotein [Bacteriovorax sp. BAL6_X]|uniref:lipoprotein n=1 Tax=Bacteriovorax sp. BAL6_X TaxID=1201290 RepID=UPI00038567F2|nr:lipoprotein [Bacteriovorax sp. BAL6_X]EPZ52278.1 putative lipoprotein [Bacteriovorax sp. BAL6_X]